MSLQVWLPLDGRLDNFGLRGDITFYNENVSNIIIDNSGKIGKCYKRSTRETDGVITSNSTVNFNSDLSMCCWAKITSVVSASDTANGLVTIHSHADNTGFAICVKEYSSSDYRISCSTGNGSSRTYNTYYGTTNIKDNWYHLALTYDSIKHELKLWVNGNCEYSGSCINASKNDYIKIFTWSTTYQGNTFKPACSLNDVRIYDHCLSVKEVKEISKGLVRHYPLNEIIGKPNLLRNSSFSTQHNQTAWNTSKNGNKEPDYWNFYNSGVNNPSTCYHAHLVQFSGEQVVEYIQETESWLGITQSGIQVYLTPGNTYTFSIWQYIPQGSNKYLTGQIYGYFQNGSENTTIVSFYCDSNRIYNKWQKFIFNLTLPTNTDCSRNLFLFIYGTAGGQGKVYMRRPKLEEGSEATPWVPNVNDAEYSSYNLGNVVYDCSGYGRNGTLSPTPPTYGSQSPRYFNCMAFNGTNNYIDCGLSNNENLPTDAITVCGWGYRDNWDQDKRIISCTQGGGFNFEGTMDRFVIYRNNEYIIASSSFSKTTGWYFLVGTYDGYVAKCYINGQLKASSTVTSTKYPIIYNNNTKLFIGCEPADSVSPSAPYWNGKISDIRIYCTAFSAQDIKELYQSSLSVDNMGNFHTHEIFENTEAQS